MPRQRGGNKIILTPANYTSDPTRFPSSDAKVSGCGCAGTKSKVAAAAGEYVSYDKAMTGGNSAYCTNCTGPAGKITGPYAGHGLVESSKNGPIPRPTGMGAGQSMKTIEETLKSMPGGGRKTRKHKKHSKKHSKKHYKKHSKKHSKGGKKSKKVSKHSRKHSRKHMRKHRGGKGQPYANVPISFGYAAGAPLPSDLSALANPAPHHAYDNCQKNDF